jgi:hypothetical protein
VQEVRVNPAHLHTLLLLFPAHLHSCCSTSTPAALPIQPPHPFAARPVSPPPLQLFRSHFNLCCCCTASHISILGPATTTTTSIATTLSLFTLLLRPVAVLPGTASVLQSLTLWYKAERSRPCLFLLLFHAATRTKQEWGAADVQIAAPMHACPC